MKRSKFKTLPSRSFQMAEIMVAQWRDDRLKSAEESELMRAYGVTLEEADKILKRELKKRGWI